MSFEASRPIASSSADPDSFLREGLSEQDEWEGFRIRDVEEDADEGEEVDVQESEEHTSPREITDEVLREIEQKLCLIKLCWPKVDLTSDVFLSTLPESYSTNSSKERLLLLYAENFRRQFHATYPTRRPLLLACRNECGVQKFVSTTIRRSTLPYPELYTWQGCAKFVSDFIEYEPPDRALIMPKHVRSPTWMAHFQRGNSFECSTFLVSLLRGQRYNAFVVSGYASREQVMCDRTRDNCPDVPTSEPVETPAGRMETSKYKLKPPPDFKSQFLRELEEEEQRRLDDKIREQEEEQQRLIAELEKPPPDKYAGHRIHSWVLLLPDKEGPRENEVSVPIFVEPTTGASYSLYDQRTNEVFFGVESVWNERNYWVNMQSSVRKCTRLNWDLTNTARWEHLLPGEPPTLERFGETVADEELLVDLEKHLDMPTSYVNEINIHSLTYEKRYPRGTKIVFYKKVKLENYAPYVQLDGLVQRITIFNDYEYKMPLCIYEKYANRTDNLVESKRDFDTNQVVDSYKRGRQDACKAHHFNISRYSQVDHERILEFYDIVRLDGLSRIEMHGTSMTQTYIGRDDRLCERYTEFSDEHTALIREDIHARPILSIVEKFSRDKSLPANKDIAIREFAIADKQIRLKYHYGENQFTRAIRIFTKPALAERGSLQIFNPDTTYIYNPDPLMPPEKSLTLYEELKKQLDEEDQCISRVRESELDIMNFLKMRASEHLEPTLTVSAFNLNRRVKSSTLEDAMEVQQIGVARQLDILDPHIARVGYPPEISKELAYILQHECLEELKHVLVSRANKIYRQFEECQEELEATEALMTDAHLQPGEKDALMERINELNSHLHALEVRLNRHRDVASEKYRMVVNLLRQSHYLRSYHNYESSIGA